MSIPTLKRIRISSQIDLTTWLSKSAAQADIADMNSVMLVSHSDKANKSHLSVNEVREALNEQAWKLERSYTLNGGLLGHVISRS